MEDDTSPLAVVSSAETSGKALTASKELHCLVVLQVTFLSVSLAEDLCTVLLYCRICGKKDASRNWRLLFASIATLFSISISI